MYLGQSVPMQTAESVRPARARSVMTATITLTKCSVTVLLLHHGSFFYINVVINDIDMSLSVCILHSMYGYKLSGV